MTRPVTIVGAGPAGSVLATYLGRRGHPVSLFESRPDLRTTDISAGRSINLALATRGIAVLDDLGLIPRVEPLLTAMRGRMVHGLDGTQSLQPYGNRPEEVIHSVSRSDLNAVLLDAAEATGNVEITFEQRCIGGSARAGRLRFRDYPADREYEVEASTIIGTDGFASAVREFTIAEAGGAAEVEPLGHGYKELTLPAGPDGRHQLDPNALHIWPRGELMLIALADIGGTFTCTLFAPAATGADNLDSLSDEAAVATFFTREFPDVVPLIPDLTRQYLTNPVGQLVTLRCRGWHVDGRSLILGDAAHAIVPFHGQGMNAAFESCKVLIEAIDRHPADWAAAFADFERTRKPDVDAIAEMALENYVEMRSGVRDDRYLLQRELALELERRHPGRFTPRYALVMFTTIPYAAARRRARAQAAILDVLTDGIDRVDDVDFERARTLVANLET